MKPKLLNSNKQELVVCWPVIRNSVWTPRINKSRLFYPTEPIQIDYSITPPTVMDSAKLAQ